jgi:5-methylcytosine-specific restriction protein A
VCQWRMPGGGLCGVRDGSNEVDHKGDRDDHRLEALQLLCVEHHKAKTLAEAAAARVSTTRPKERHPGLL